MSNGATTELNFRPASKSQFQKLFDHGRNIRAMQSSMSKIDPEVLKSMLGSATTNVKSPETSPLTIFYNGTVSIFEVPRDKAEAIMRVAREANKKPEPVMTEPANGEHNLLEKLNGDLPIARKKSLQRFLEKRRERCQDRFRHDLLNPGLEMSLRGDKNVCYQCFGHIQCRENSMLH